MLHLAKSRVEVHLRVHGRGHFRAEHQEARGLQPHGSRCPCGEAGHISAFIFELHASDAPLIEFDNKLWLTVVHTAIAYRDGRLVFTFRNGTEIEG